MVSRSAGPQGPTEDIADVIIDTSPSQVPQFHRALGAAITTWQTVELEACGVFSKVSTCQDEKIAAAMFYTPQDFSQKLAITHHAARLYLTDMGILEEWKALRKRLIQGSEIRNALAHFHIAFAIEVGESATVILRKISHTGEIIPAEPEEKPGERVGHLWLRPNSFNPNEQFKDRTNKSKEPMVIKDIVRANRTFAVLGQDTKAFAAKIPPPATPQKE